MQYIDDIIFASSCNILLLGIMKWWDYNFFATQVLCCMVTGIILIFTLRGKK